MARLKPISTMADWVGSNVGSSGSIMHTTAVQSGALSNVLDSRIYQTDSGKDIWEKSRNVTHRVNDFISTMTSSNNSVMIGSPIKALTTGPEILLAEGEMIGYIMTHPEMYQAYTEGADFFEGWKPEKGDTVDHNPYHDRLWSGIMVEEGDELVTHTYSDDSPLETLSFDEQVKIFKTHSSITDLDLPELYEQYYLLE